MEISPEILYPACPNIENKNNYMSKKFYKDIDNNNKTFKLSRLKSIDIEDFRTFKHQTLDFGEYVTIIAGQNGSMKSTLMGLSTHPFNTDAKDVNGKKMSTDIKNVFNWSNNKDTSKYQYSMLFSLNNGRLLKEPVEVVPEPISEPNRHRITVSGHAKGDGQLLLPVTYLNLKRLFPLVDMNKNTDWDNTSQNFTDDEKTFIADFYFNVLQRMDFTDFSSYDARAGRYHKIAKGPSGANSLYDADTISSGEDNLGIIVDQLVSFMRLYNSKSEDEQKVELTGILAIDEFEASLHPSSQRLLLNYLIDFARKFKVQVLVTTHSLSLITDIMHDKSRMIERGLIKINFITKPKGIPVIVHNPNYEVAYRELTLRNEIVNPFKIRVRLEDKVAESFFKNLISDDLKKEMIFSTKLTIKKDDGSSYTDLQNIAMTYPSLFTETNSLVVFDGDVSDKLTKKVTSTFHDFIKLPSLDIKSTTGEGLPLEKELVYWVTHLNPSDKVFTIINKSQQMLFAEWASAGIQANRPHYHTLPTKVFKAWAKSNPGIFNRLEIEYCKRAPTMFPEFYNKLRVALNRIVYKNGLPIKN